MLTKTRKTMLTALAALICIAMMAATAYAGNSFTGYNTVVGKINGNGYSPTQTKATSGANGRVKSTSVGGGYTVDVRMQKSDATASGAWYRNLGSGTDTGYTVGGHVNQMYGDTVRLHFSNDLTTLVDVQVIGEWMSQ